MDRFNECADLMTKLAKEPTNDEKLLAYALFKR